MKSFVKVMVLMLFLSSSALSQSEGTKPSLIGTLPEPRIVPSLAKQLQDGTFVGVDPDEPVKMGNPKRAGANIIVPGKGLPKGNDPLVAQQKLVAKKSGREPLLVFDANVATYTPSDPTGAVGPNHYLGGWNVGFRIFDKEGEPLTPPASLSTLFPGNNAGDPIMLYDVEADRYIITEFDFSPNGLNFAISAGPDPVNDDWYVYTTGMGTGSFPDYPKFSIWSDGYYVTANINSSNRVFVIERDKVLDGETPQFLGFPLPGIRTSGFYSPQFFNVTNGNLPPPGNATIVYLQDDAWSGVSQDHLKLWTLNVDWETPGNSSISNPVELITTPFISVFDGGSFSNRPQPSGPDIDVLQAIIMQQAQYRRFPDYNAVVFNFVVDTDGSSGELAGVRWYELRQYDDDAPWEIHQEGTYISPYGNKDAFAASMAMDAYGNIGMAYSTVSTQESIAIYFTGRYASDPPGVMTVDETLIAQGNSNNPSFRYADYTHLTLDPADDLTFWHISEYFMNNQRRDVVGVFQLTAEMIKDVGIIELIEPHDGLLSEEQQITVSIFNYGTQAIGNIPVGYFMSGGDTIIETRPGILPGGESAEYTFQATADMGQMGETYQLTLFTGLSVDQNLENDTITVNVTHLYPRDVGISSVNRPESGTGLSDAEIVEVTLKNYGATDQSGFDLTYALNGEITTESFIDTLFVGTELNYEFATTADMYELGTYEIIAYSSLEGDYDHSNDTTSVVITKSNCQPESDCSDGVAILYIELRDLINESECSENGYSDFTAYITDLESGSQNDLIMKVGYGDTYVKTWIDFNDNFIFEDDEVVIDNHIIAPGEGAGVYIDTIPLNIADDVMYGEHLMRVKINLSEEVPINSCEETLFGETEDYRVNLIIPTGTSPLPEMSSEMEVRPYGNKQFEISLISPRLNGPVLINLHNSMGLNLVENKVAYGTDRYTYHLDMSYAASGVYIVRMGTYKYGKVQKIVIH